MVYRIEFAKGGRAGCRDSHCKREGIKIEKGEPRFGTWVDIGDHASFHWKHWGCVTGKQMENLRKYLHQEDPDGPYRWEYMDGLEEMDDNFKRKFKTAVIEGKIADEDWNGDPEYNTLGQIGIRARYKKPKSISENEDDDAKEAEQAPLVAPKKRARSQKIEGDDERETKPVKKRITKARAVKKETEDDSEDHEESNRGKRAKKNSPATKVRDEQDPPIVEQVEAKLVKAARAKKGTVKIEGDDSVEDLQQQKPAKTGRGRKKTASTVKPEDEVGNLQGLEEADEDLPARKTSAQSKNGKVERIVKEEPIDLVELGAKPKKKGSRKKSVKEEDTNTTDARSEELNANSSVMSARELRAAKRGHV